MIISELTEIFTDYIAKIIVKNFTVKSYCYIIYKHSITDGTSEKYYVMMLLKKGDFFFTPPPVKKRVDWQRVKTREKRNGGAQI